MNLDFSPEHDDLRRIVREYLRLHTELHGRAHADTDPAACRASLEAFAATFDLYDMWVPKRLGGQGCGLTELAVLAEELGRWLAPNALVNAGVAALVLARTSSAAADTILEASSPPRLAYAHAAGRAEACFVGGPGRASVTGEVSGVPHGMVADVLVLGLSDGLAAVDLTSPGVRRRRTDSLDLTGASASITLTEAPTDPLSTFSADAEWALAAACTALAFESLGSMRALLDATVQHVSTRVQFGAPVGSFQAVKHQATDIAVAVDQLDAVTRWVLAVEERDDAAEFVRLSRVAASIATKGYRTTTQTATQLHGGIGFTWELGLHLALRRAMTNAVLYDDSYGLSTKIGRDFVDTQRSGIVIS